MVPFSIDADAHDIPRVAKAPAEGVKCICFEASRIKLRKHAAPLEARGVEGVQKHDRNFGVGGVRADEGGLNGPSGDVSGQRKAFPLNGICGVDRCSFDKIFDARRNSGDAAKQSVPPR